MSHKMTSEKERLLRLHFGNSSSSFHSEKAPLLRSLSNIQQGDTYRIQTKNDFFIRSPSKLIDNEEDLLKVFKKTGKVQVDLRDTIQTVNNVVDQLLNRGANLNSIYTKCEILEKSANHFKRQAIENAEKTQRWYLSFASKKYRWLILCAIPTLALFYAFFKIYNKAKN